MLVHKYLYKANNYLHIYCFINYKTVDIYVTLEEYVNMIKKNNCLLQIFLLRLHQIVC